MVILKCTIIDPSLMGLYADIRRVKINIHRTLLWWAVCVCMYVYVSLYVCMYVCVSVCVCVCVCMCVCVNEYVC